MKTWMRKHRIIRQAISLFVLVAFFAGYVVPEASSVTEIGRPAASSGVKLGDLERIDVDAVTIPQYLGTIRDTSQGTSNKLLIHIQDAHCNYDAQKRIAQIIKYFNTEFGIDLVNLEGGKGEYDLSVFDLIRDEKARERVADYFVSQGVMNGAECFSASSERRTQLWGIEDEKLYLANLKIYRDSLGYKDEVEKYLKSLDYFISNLRRNIYSKDLLEMDSKYSAYKSGDLGFKEYLNFIMLKARQNGIDIKSFPNIYLLSQSLMQEEKIDFRKANRQRDDLVDRLQKMLSRRMLEELVMKTTQFKAKRLSQYDFYEYLINMAHLANIDMEEYPELQKYIVYISLYHAVDKSMIMTELDTVESDIKEFLYQNDKERRLNLLSKNLTLTKNIFDIELSKNDYEYYKENKASFDTQNFISFINREAPLYKITVVLEREIQKLDQYRERIEEFYEYSFKRDDAFMRNIRFGGERVQAAIIVTGGFHTENLCELFKKQGISYVSILPNFVNEEGYTSPYFKLLAGGETPIEKEIGSALSFIQIASPFSSLGEAVNGEQAINRQKLAALILGALESGQPVVVRRADDTLLRFSGNIERGIDIEEASDATADITVSDSGTLAFHTYIGQEYFADTQLAEAERQPMASTARGRESLDDVERFLRELGREDVADELKSLSERGDVHLVTGIRGFTAQAGGRGIHITSAIDDVDELGGVLAHESHAYFFTDPDLRPEELDARSKRLQRLFRQWKRTGRIGEAAREFRQLAMRPVVSGMEEGRDFAESDLGRAPTLATTPGVEGLLTAEERKTAEVKREESWKDFLEETSEGLAGWWILKADGPKMRSRDHFWGAQATDWTNLVTKDIVIRFALERGVSVFFTGKGSDEFTFSISKEYTKEQIRGLINELYDEFDKEFGKYDVALVDSNIGPEEVEALENAGARFVKTVRRPGTNEGGTTIIYEKGSKGSVLAALDNMGFEASLGSLGVPYLPFGVARASNADTFEGISKKADDVQEQNKNKTVAEEGELVTFEDEVGVEEEEAEPAEELLPGTVRSKQPAIVEGLKDMKESGAELEAAFDFTYREDLGSMINREREKTLRNRPREDGVDLARGPPDEFYVMDSKEDGDFELVKLIPAYYVKSDSPQARKIAEKFQEIVASGRGVRRAGPRRASDLKLDEGHPLFGFAGINTALGHDDADLVIAVVGQIIRAVFKENRDMPLKGKINEITRRLNEIFDKENTGFGVVMTATQISEGQAADWAEETGKNFADAMISSVDNLGEAREVVDDASYTGAGNLLKEHVQYESEDYQAEIRDAVDLADFHRYQRARDVLDSTDPENAKKRARGIVRGESPNIVDSYMRIYSMMEEGRFNEEAAAQEIDRIVADIRQTFQEPQDRQEGRTKRERLRNFIDFAAGKAGNTADAENLKDIHNELIAIWKQDITVPSTEKPSQMANLTGAQQVLDHMPKAIAEKLNEMGLEKQDVKEANSIVKMVGALYELMDLLDKNYHNQGHNLPATYVNLLLTEASGNNADAKIAFLAGLFHDFHLRTAGRPISNERGEIVGYQGTPAYVEETIRQIRDILGIESYEDPAEGFGNEQDYAEYFLKGEDGRPVIDSSTGRPVRKGERILRLLRDGVIDFVGEENLESVVKEVEVLVRRTDFPSNVNTQALNAKDTEGNFIHPELRLLAASLREARNNVTVILWGLDKEVGSDEGDIQRELRNMREAFRDQAEKYRTGDEAEQALSRLYEIEANYLDALIETGDLNRQLTLHEMAQNMETADQGGFYVTLSVDGIKEIVKGLHEEDPKVNDWGSFPFFAEVALLTPGMLNTIRGLPVENRANFVRFLDEFAEISSTSEEAPPIPQAKQAFARWHGLKEWEGEEVTPAAEGKSRAEVLETLGLVELSDGEFRESQIAEISVETAPSVAARLQDIQLSNEQAGKYIKSQIRDELFADNVQERRAKLEEMAEEGEQAFEDGGVIFIKIKGLYEYTGQLGHIGLGNTYGRTVVYIDADAADNRVVRRHELEEIKLWENQIRRGSLRGVVKDLSGIRAWMWENTEEAFRLADELHGRANERFNVDEAAREMEAEGVLPSPNLASPNLTGTEDLVGTPSLSAQVGQYASVLVGTLRKGGYIDRAEREGLRLNLAWLGSRQRATTDLERGMHDFFAKVAQLTRELYYGRTIDLVEGEEFTEGGEKFLEIMEIRRLIESFIRREIDEEISRGQLLKAEMDIVLLQEFLRHINNASLWEIGGGTIQYLWSRLNGLKPIREGDINSITGEWNAVLGRVRPDRVTEKNIRAFTNLVAMMGVNPAAVRSGDTDITAMRSLVDSVVNTGRMTEVDKLLEALELINSDLRRDYMPRMERLNLASFRRLCLAELNAKLEKMRASGDVNVAGFAEQIDSKLGEFLLDEAKRAPARKSASADDIQMRPESLDVVEAVLARSMSQLKRGVAVDETDIGDLFDHFSQFEILRIEGRTTEPMPAANIYRAFMQRASGKIDELLSDTPQGDIKYADAIRSRMAQNSIRQSDEKIKALEVLKLTLQQAPFGTPEEQSNAREQLGTSTTYGRIALEIAANNNNVTPELARQYVREYLENLGRQVVVEMLGRDINQIGTKQLQQLDDAIMSFELAGLLVDEKDQTRLFTKGGLVSILGERPLTATEKGKILDKLAEMIEQGKERQKLEENIEEVAENARIVELESTLIEAVEEYESLNRKLERMTLQAGTPQGIPAELYVAAINQRARALEKAIDARALKNGLFERDSKGNWIDVPEDIAEEEREMQRLAQEASARYNELYEALGVDPVTASAKDRRDAVFENVNSLDDMQVGRALADKDFMRSLNNVLRNAAPRELQAERDRIDRALDEGDVDDQAVLWRQMLGGIKALFESGFTNIPASDSDAFFAYFENPYNNWRRARYNSANSIIRALRNVLGDATRFREMGLYTLGQTENLFQLKAVAQVIERHIAELEAQQQAERDRMARAQREQALETEYDIILNEVNEILNVDLIDAVRDIAIDARLEAYSSRLQDMLAEAEDLGMDYMAEKIRVLMVKAGTELAARRTAEEFLASDVTDENLNDAQLVANLKIAGAINRLFYGTLTERLPVAEGEAGMKDGVESLKGMLGTEDVSLSEDGAELDIQGEAIGRDALKESGPRQISVNGNDFTVEYNDFMDQYIINRINYRQLSLAQLYYLTGRILRAFADPAKRPDAIAALRRVYEEYTGAPVEESRLNDFFDSEFGAYVADANNAERIKAAAKVQRITDGNLALSGIDAEDTTEYVAQNMDERTALNFVIKVFMPVLLGDVVQEAGSQPSLDEFFEGFTREAAMARDRGDLARARELADRLSEILSIMEVLYPRVSAYPPGFEWVKEFLKTYKLEIARRLDQFVRDINEMEEARKKELAEKEALLNAAQALVSAYNNGQVDLGDMRRFRIRRQRERQGETLRTAPARVRNIIKAVSTADAGLIESNTQENDEGLEEAIFSALLDEARANLERYENTGNPLHLRRAVNIMTALSGYTESVLPELTRRESMSAEHAREMGSFRQSLDDFKKILNDRILDAVDRADNPGRTLAAIGVVVRKSAAERAKVAEEFITSASESLLLPGLRMVDDPVLGARIATAEEQRRRQGREATPAERALEIKRRIKNLIRLGFPEILYGVNFSILGRRRDTVTEERRDRNREVVRRLNEALERAGEEARVAESANNLLVWGERQLLMDAVGKAKTAEGVLSVLGANDRVKAEVRDMVGDNVDVLKMHIATIGERGYDIFGEDGAAVVDHLAQHITMNRAEDRLDEIDQRYNEAFATALDEDDLRHSAVNLAHAANTGPVRTVSNMLQGVEDDLAADDPLNERKRAFTDKVDISGYSQVQAMGYIAEYVLNNAKQSGVTIEEVQRLRIARDMDNVTGKLREALDNAVYFFFGENAGNFRELVNTADLFNMIAREAPERGLLSERQMREQALRRGMLSLDRVDEVAEIAADALKEEGYDARTVDRALAAAEKDEISTNRRAAGAQEIMTRILVDDLGIIGYARDVRPALYEKIRELVGVPLEVPGIPLTGKEAQSERVGQDVSFFGEIPAKEAAVAMVALAPAGTRSRFLRKLNRELPRSGFGAPTTARGQDVSYNRQIELAPVREEASAEDQIEALIKAAVTAYRAQAGANQFTEGDVVVFVPVLFDADGNEIDVEKRIREHFEKEKIEEAGYELRFVRDRYTDFNFKKGAYPDILARYGIARVISYYGRSTNEAAKVNARNIMMRILRQIGDPRFVSDLENMRDPGEFFNFIMRTQGIMISPLSFEALRDWMDMFEEIAVSV